jgi:hypothetical protein
MNHDELPNEESPLQEPFLRELAAAFRATQDRMARRLCESEPGEHSNIVAEELKGLYHGLLVILDGGTSLADLGLISIVDENGIPFARGLHEPYADYWRE